jgi:hypothetical protein
MKNQWKINEKLMKNYEKNQNLWKKIKIYEKSMKNQWKINENLWKIYEKIKIYEKKLKIILNFWTVPSGPLVKFSKKMEIVPSGPVPSGPSWL